MTEQVFSLTFIEYAKLLVVALLLYAIIFALLKKTAFFEDNNVNALIALLSAVIVSFSGVLAYVVTYAVNLFAIVLIVLFLIFILMYFIGVKPESMVSDVSPKVVFGILGVIFLVVFLSGYFALANLFDTRDPDKDPFEVDPSFATGFEDVINQEEAQGFFSNIINSLLNSELFYAALFLSVLGVFVMLLGK